MGEIEIRDAFMKLFTRQKIYKKCFFRGNGNLLSSFLKWFSLG